MRSRRAVLALSITATAVVAAVAFAVRAGGPPQRLAAPAATASPAPTPAAGAIPQVRLGDYLDAGTYALPGGAWIFDVPEGMRLRHHWLADGGPAVSYGFMEQTATASFSFNAKPDSIEFWIQAEGSTPAAREIASAWLDAVEASVRRPPDYAEPVRGAAAEGPGANPDGIPYLRDYNHSEEVFRRRSYLRHT